MADFDLVVASGSTVLPWADGAYLSTPSRSNALAGLPHRYHLKTIASTLKISCVVGGVTAPLDTALGGRLFLWNWVDLPSTHQPPIVPPAGQSSTIEFEQADFDVSGHHTILAWRPGGGAIGLSFEVTLL